MAHPRLRQAKEDLLDAIESSPPGSLILVVGPTGVGKTTLRRKVEESLSERLMESMAMDPSRLPFISIEAVAPDNGNFQWRDYFHRVLMQMREPLLEYKLGSSRGETERDSHGSHVASPRGFTGYQLQQSLENALRYRRPAAVFIDEAQHLARMASGRKLADQLDVIKSIASRSQTIHVLIGTYELLAFRNLSGQLSRRSVDLHFSRYCSENANDIEVFQNAVFTFQGQLPLSGGFDLVAAWDFLYERSLGCIGVLKDWLMRALIASLRNENSTLTLPTLEKTALSVSQCEKILSEAREGEARLAEANDRCRLRHLLNLPANGSPLVNESSTPERKARQGSPGRRRPQRDAIGKSQVSCG
jgi:energy-coupling factor transporter ATP-binding protein EcfA2